MSAFTSDLSVADFALCHRLGLRPVAQVMGTSVYQVGYQPTMYGLGFGGEFGELSVLSEAWNDARDLAFSRLAKEASQAHANAVVGVDVRVRSSAIAAESGINAIEYTVLGTAVQRDGAHRGAPVLTELSVADYSKLIDAGIEPVGVVASTSVFFVSAIAVNAERQFTIGSSFQNYEIESVTQCFYTAREQVMAQIGEQAKALQASGIVGTRITHRAAPQTIGGRTLGEGQRNVVMVTMSAIGTAIQEERGQGSVGALRAPMLTTDLLS